MNALILVDIQNDFCPGGALAVRDGDAVVPVANALMPLFSVIVAGHDWHPPDHCSFKEQGGPWPPHCVPGTCGAELHPCLDQSRITYRTRKAFTRDNDSYSEFDGVDDLGRSLDKLLKDSSVTGLCVCGLATDYCVRATVLDALKRGYPVTIVTDGVRAVDVHSGDGERALKEMRDAGARLLTADEVMAEIRTGCP